MDPSIRLSHAVFYRDVSKLLKDLGDVAKHWCWCHRSSHWRCPKSNFIYSVSNHGWWGLVQISAYVHFHDLFTPVLHIHGCHSFHIHCTQDDDRLAEHLIRTKQTIYYKRWRSWSPRSGGHQPRDGFPPQEDEVKEAIGQPSNGKAPGVETIPAEVCKAGSPSPHQQTDRALSVILGKGSDLSRGKASIIHL